MKLSILYYKMFALLCAYLTSFTMVLAQQPVVTVEIVSPVTQCYSPDGSAKATVNGETDGYSFVWYDYHSGEVVSNESLLTEGESEFYTLYTVTATDNATGLTSLPVEIAIEDETIRSDNDLWQHLITYPNTSCNANFPNGSVRMEGMYYDDSRYYYRWFTQQGFETNGPWGTPLAEGSSEVYELPAGVYMVHIIDEATGCETIEPFEIPDEINQPFVLLEYLQNASSCNAADGSIEVNVLNSWALDDYTFEWHRNTDNVVFLGRALDNLTPGEYTVVVTDNQTGCVSEPSTFTVGYYSTPADPAIAVIDQSCVGDTIRFSAQGRDKQKETYSWQIIKVEDNTTGLTVALPDSLQTDPSFDWAIATPGNFVAQLTLSNECEVDTVLVQEFTINAHTDLVLPESITLCGNSVALTAINPAEDNGNHTFVWRYEDAQQELSNANTVAVTKPGRYAVTVTSAGGCVSSSEVLVVDSQQQVKLPEDFALCQQESYELNVEVVGFNNPIYAWRALDETGTNVFTASTPTLEVTKATPNAGTYTYTVTVSDQSSRGCSVQDTVQVTVHPLLEAVIAQQGNQLSAPLGEQFTYQWYLNGEILSEKGASIMASQRGEYTVKVTNDHQCTTTSKPVSTVVTGLSPTNDSAFITVFPNPSQDVFWVRTHQASTLRVVDITGNIIVEQPQKLHLAKIELSDYSSGVYVLQIITEGKTFARRLYKY